MLLFCAGGTCNKEEEVVLQIIPSPLRGEGRVRVMRFCFFIFTPTYTSPLKGEE